MPTATAADGVTVHFEVADVGEGPDVVLIHGITESWRAWEAVINDLAGDHRVIALDLRGHGRSSIADDYSVIAMGRDVAAVVAEAGVQAPLVVGHSLGGVVATTYAASGAPVRGVVNVDQPLHLAGFQAQLREIEPMLRDPATFPAVMDALIAGLAGDATPAELIRDLESHRRADQEVVLAIWDAVLTSPIEALEQLVDGLVSAVKAPYLAVHFGDAGPDYESWLKARIPQAEYEQWPGLGHWGHLVERERFTARVREFEQTLSD